MAINVEIKARVAGMGRVNSAAAKIASSPGEQLIQEDRYFVCDSGRLKLRRCPGKKAELIYYERPSDSAPKISEYFRAFMPDEENLISLLDVTLGLTLVVRKARTLYWFENVRIHLDEVELLGAFLELEVVMKEGDCIEEGRRKAYKIMEFLGVSSGELIDCSYADLMRNKEETDRLSG